VNKRSVILIVDDTVANIEILNAALEGDYDICFATSGEEALAIAIETQPDLILLDVLMPGIDGYEVCRRLKANPLVADVPVIFVTGRNDQEAEVQGLLVGAIDYVTKPISPVIVRARVRNHLEMKFMRDRLAELAATDALTGMNNRRRLEQSLTLETARLARSNDWLSVIMVDIDFFKQFNDTYGHPAGDRCILLVGQAINKAVRRAVDLTARYGGEEFVAVLPGATYEAAMMVAHNILDQVHDLDIPHTWSAAAAHVSVSLGVATARCAPAADPARWIRAADLQLYEAKAAGRNRVLGTLFDVATDPPDRHRLPDFAGVAGR
jgi:diguanylate cyclase (GGDEF)-like protein